MVEINPGKLPLLTKVTISNCSYKSPDDNSGNTFNFRAGEMVKLGRGEEIIKFCERCTSETSGAKIKKDELVVSEDGVVEKIEVMCDQDCNYCARMDKG